MIFIDACDPAMIHLENVADPSRTTVLCGRDTARLPYRGRPGKWAKSRICERCATLGCAMLDAMIDATHPIRP